MTRQRATSDKLWSNEPILDPADTKCAAWANAFLQEGKQVDGSTLAEAAEFCTQHRLEAPLDALCSRAALGLGKGFVQTSDALQVAEAALKIRAGDPASQWRCNMEHGTNNLFFTLLRMAAQVPVNLDLGDLKTLVVTLLRWAVLRRGQNAPFDPRSSFSGVAVAAAPLLGRPNAPEGEALGLAHALASGLQLFPSMADSAESRAVEEVLRVALAIVRKRLHRLSPEQVAELAGAAASAWISTSETLREDVLKHCLADVSQAVRFRRAAFQVGELVAVAVALGKAGLKADVVADVLLQRFSQGGESFSNHDLIIVVRTCSHGCWPDERLTSVALKEMKTRDFSTFSPQDFCLVAQSMAYFKDHSILANEASELLEMVADAGQGADLSNLTLTQKIQLLQDLAVAETPHVSTCGLLVEQIWYDAWVALPGNLPVGLLRALAKLCLHSTATDGNETKLLWRVIKLAPWSTARPDEVTSITCALSPLPMLLDHVSQDSLSHSLLRIDAKNVTHDELTSILVILWKCACRDATRVAATSLRPFAAEAKARLTCTTDESAVSSLQALAEALVHTGAAVFMQPRNDSEESTTGEHIVYPSKVVTESDSEEDIQEEGEGTPSDEDLHGTMPVTPYGTRRRRRQLQTQVVSDDGLTQPSCQDGSDGLQMQLNRQGDFSGHCIQIKNTFIHIACENEGARVASDSDNDCVVCRRLSRTRSSSEHNFTAQRRQWSAEDSDDEE